MPNYISVPNQFINGTTADADQVNANFTALINGLSASSNDINVGTITTTNTGGISTICGPVILGTVGFTTQILGNLSSSISIYSLSLSNINIGSSQRGITSLYLNNGIILNRTTALSTKATSAYSLYFPTGLPAGNGYSLESDSSGNLSFSNRRITPTIQIFTSGNGTYTTPAGVLYLEVEMVGAGGGGGGSGSGGFVGGSGVDGASTTFLTSPTSGVLLTATGGGGADVLAANNTIAGGGGVASIVAPAIGFGITGSAGAPSPAYNGINGATMDLGGGAGGASAFGGSGKAGFAVAGSAGSDNSGAGGGGAGSAGTTGQTPGPGGGSGAYISAIIPNPSSEYLYDVGVGGTAGTAGAGGFLGGAGADGIIIVREYYQ